MSTPMLVLLFGAMIVIAWLVQIPWWLIAVGAVAAVIGYLLERRRD
jgi:4-hydroxybenzoate polyprenyltransferase